MLSSFERVSNFRFPSIYVLLKLGPRLKARKEICYLLKKANVVLESNIS